MSAAEAIEPSAGAADPGASFTLRAKIGHGGMATIYVGQRVDSSGAEREVAVKVLHPHLAEDPHIRKMFLHEAALAERMHHPNVVGVIDKGEDAEHGTFIVLEYVEGGDLAKVLKAAAQRRKRLPPGIVARLLMDLCLGLHIAHELAGDDGAPLNLIHRDVSPHNLLIGIDGVARLIDFGIARSDERYTMTRPGQLKGKLAYMAPEQLAHEKDVDRRLDVFAAGTVLWEALLSRRLFKGEDEVSIINKVLLSEIEPPSKAHEALAPFDAVIERALARKPDERFATAMELADAIEAAAGQLEGGLAGRKETAEVIRELLSDFLDERAARIETSQLTPLGRRNPRPIPVPDHSQITSTATPAKRSPLVWILAGLLLLALGAIGAILVWPQAPGTAANGEPTDGSAASTAASTTEPATLAPPEVDRSSEPVEPAADPAETIEAAPVEAAPSTPRARSRRTRRARARRGPVAEAPETSETSEASETSEPAATETTRQPGLGATPSDDLEVNPYAN